jgi:hypothetical protein
MSAVTFVAVKGKSPLWRERAKGAGKPRNLEFLGEGKWGQRETDAIIETTAEWSLAVSNPVCGS